MHFNLLRTYSFLFSLSNLKLVFCCLWSDVWSSVLRWRRSLRGWQTPLVDVLRSHHQQGATCLTSNQIHEVVVFVKLAYFIFLNPTLWPGFRIIFYKLLTLLRLRRFTIVILFERYPQVVEVKVVTKLQ
jgi:hypothetical protein